MPGKGDKAGNLTRARPGTHIVMDLQCHRAHVDDGGGKPHAALPCGQGANMKQAVRTRLLAQPLCHQRAASVEPCLAANTWLSPSK